MERRALHATSPQGSIWIGSLELPDYRGEFMPTGGRWVRGSPWSQCQWVLVQGTHGWVLVALRNALPMHTVPSEKGGLLPLCLGQRKRQREGRKGTGKNRVGGEK